MKPITGDYGQHALQIQSSDINTNAATSSLRNRPLAIYDAQALDARRGAVSHA